MPDTSTHLYSSTSFIPPHLESTYLGTAVLSKARQETRRMCRGERSHNPFRKSSRFNNFISHQWTVRRKTHFAAQKSNRIEITEGKSRESLLELRERNKNMLPNTGKCPARSLKYDDDVMMMMMCISVWEISEGQELWVKVLDEKWEDQQPWIFLVDLVSLAQGYSLLAKSISSITILVPHGMRSSSKTFPIHRAMGATGEKAFLVVASWL